MRRGSSRTNKRSTLKNKKRRSVKTTRKSMKKRHSRRHQRHQKGGVLYTFDNNDIIAGLPAVKAISNCPPGVSATDPEWGIKVYEKYQSQTGGMNRDNLRLDVIEEAKSANSKKNNTK